VTRRDVRYSGVIPLCFLRRQRQSGSRGRANLKKETLDLVRAAGGDGLFVKTDVSRAADVRALV